MAAGGEIKRLRELAGKSAAVAASFIGVDAERMRKWESKNVDPADTEDIRKVENYFGVPINELISLETFQFIKKEDKSTNSVIQEKYIALLEKSLEEKESVIQSIKAELSEFKAVFENFKKLGAENRISLEKSRRDLNTIMDRQNALIDALSLFLPPPQDHQGNFGETVDTIFVQHRSARNRTGSKSYTGKSHT